MKRFLILRRCHACGVERSLDDFAAGSGPGRKCKPCESALRSEWRRRNPERARIYTAKWKASNPDHDRVKHLRRKYGISVEQYDQMWDKQWGLCAICKKPEKVRSRGEGPAWLAVDHDHDTGEVRGLLCLGCNTTLHAVERKPGWVEAAVAYLHGEEVS